MKLNELPQETQNELREKRAQLCKTMAMNDGYNVVFVDDTGRRYFEAHRVSIPWTNDKGGYMPFGGGTYWRVFYGAILWDWRRDPVGDKEYFWVRSHHKIFGKSANGTIIPRIVDTKREVMEIAKAIGIFNI